MIKKHTIVKFKGDSGKILQGLVLEVGKVNVKIFTNEKMWFVPKTELLEIWG